MQQFKAHSQLSNQDFGKIKLKSIGFDIVVFEINKISYFIQIQILQIQFLCIQVIIISTMTNISVHLKMAQNQKGINFSYKLLKPYAFSQNALTKLKLRKDELKQNFFEFIIFNHKFAYLKLGVHYSHTQLYALSHSINRLKLRLYKILLQPHRKGKLLRAQFKIENIDFSKQTYKEFF
ncbi:unnamed protein product [Paramecium octaurelia]|uniref:Uncharacterized protein n=1 Tax=Paramecium octaurelia TaxID=43137 RepID=A0A8S1Y1Q9_PAROT|nr:unnamed protein product [Paramecium octaurelia]